MVQVIKCDCNNRHETNINSISSLDNINTYFEEQVKKNIFKEISVEKPFYIWIKGKEKKQYFASKWYKCQVCGCLWEVDYPDFPSQGFVRKFEDGIYKERYIIDYNKENNSHVK